MCGAQSFFLPPVCRCFLVSMTLWTSGGTEAPRSLCSGESQCCPGLGVKVVTPAWDDPKKWRSKWWATGLNCHISLFLSCFNMFQPIGVSNFTSDLLPSSDIGTILTMERFWESHLISMDINGSWSQALREEDVSSKRRKVRRFFPK